MKFIPTYVHGLIDYVVGIVLLLSPSLFGFSEYSGAPILVPRLLGTVIILQALCTDYEVGLVRMLSMRAHIVNDYVISALLAVSPWLFGFSTLPMNAWLPHVVVGIAGIVIALCSQTEPVRTSAVYT